MKNLSIKLVIALIIFPCLITFAGPPVFVPSDPDAGPVGVPVDGGASLLLAAGAGYGFKKLKAARERKKADKM